MKSSSKTKTLFLFSIGLTNSVLAQTPAIVYQDTFDGDGINTNLGTGGGGEMTVHNSGVAGWGWTDDTDTDGLVAGSALAGFRITTFVSEQSFNLAEGFTLEVTFDMLSNTNDGPSVFGSNHFSFGLSTTNALESAEFFSTGSFSPTDDAIGFSLGTRSTNIDMGLLQWDADASADPDNPGLTEILDNITFALGTEQTITLVVEPDAIDPTQFNYTYTYGALTGSGQTTIDLTQVYFFRARTQGSNGNAIRSISLTTTSPPFEAPTLIPTASIIELGDAVDLDITFDTSAESAELTSPSGVSVDLLAIDANDSAPNDGIVTVSQSPTERTTFTIVTMRSDSPDQSASSEILVADPSSEAPDNAFSLAIAADSPLFYYRYEDDVTSDLLLDSSGNGNHTSDITNFGSLVSLASPNPGGMQNAADFTLNTSILVPATSEVSESFTLMTMMNLINPQVGGTIFSIADGTGTGDPILTYAPAGFTSALGGELNSISSPTPLVANNSCLIHMVFTANPDPAIEGGELALFINGVAEGTPITLPSFPANEGNWIIASNPILGSNSYRDFLDETAAFESALTQAQITAHVDAFFTAADPFLGFSSDTNEISQGDSVQFTWKVSDQATAVTINGEPVEGNVEGGIFTASFSPTITTDFVIEVTGPDGPLTSTQNVVVLVPDNIDTPITITSCSADNATPPNVVIEFIGAPDTTYQVLSSSNLVDFTTPVVSVTTDVTGAGIASFAGAAAPATNSFYQIEFEQ